MASARINLCGNNVFPCNKTVTTLFVLSRSRIAEADKDF
jgi:hypothetical protein